MSQFCVHANANPATRSAYPFLLDIQSPLLEELATRVVVPLAPREKLRHRPLSRLVPILRVDGAEYLMLTPQLAGVPVKHLGYVVQDLSRERLDIVAALDTLVAGI